MKEKYPIKNGIKIPEKKKTGPKINRHRADAVQEAIDEVCFGKSIKHAIDEKLSKYEHRPILVGNTLRDRKYLFKKEIIEGLKQLSQTEHVRIELSKIKKRASKPQ